ncbi:unnamed protein product [Brassica rapa subsp. narinosa]
MAVEFSQGYHWVSYALEVYLLEMAPERPSLECPGCTITTATSTISRYQSYIMCAGPSWLNQLIQEEAVVDVAPDWDSSKPLNVVGSLEAFFKIHFLCSLVPFVEIEMSHLSSLSY